MRTQKSKNFEDRHNSGKGSNDMSHCGRCPLSLTEHVSPLITVPKLEHVNISTQFDFHAHKRNCLIKCIELSSKTSPEKHGKRKRHLMNILHPPSSTHLSKIGKVHQKAKNTAPAILLRCNT